MTKKLILSVLSALCLTLAAEARLSIRNPYNEGMVLQRNTSAAVKGYSEPGSAVVLCTSWNGRKYKVKADENGMWTAYVDTPEGGYTNYTIDVRSGKESYVIKDVLVGEVWFASGQSNMEMPVAGWGVVKEAMDYVTAPDASNRIRVFEGRLCQSYTKETYTDGWWFKGNPEGIPNMSAVAYFFARKLNDVLDVPVGVIVEAYGGTRLEAWLPEDLYRSYGDTSTVEQIEQMNRMYRPYTNYNAMISPCIGYTIKGFLWYQGCSNVGASADDYLKRFSDMVARWRSDWGDNSASLPFYTVELAPFAYTVETGQAGHAVEIRSAQWKAADIVPNCCVVCTNDTVEEALRNDIHPMNKKPVGDRLAYLALARNYGYTNLHCYAATAGSASSHNDHEVEVVIENPGLGLLNLDKIRGMEVAGEDGVFHPVEMASFEEWNNNTLRVWSEDVVKPVAIRYGWGDFVPGNIRTRLGQPLAPFCLEVKR